MAEMIASDGKVDAVGTSAGSENEITEAVCKGCSKTFKPALLYRCNTCVGSSVSSTDDNNLVEYFCRFCIVAFHLKQKHEIIDGRGYRPAICEDHENICNLFCKKCIIVICNCCVDNHSTHTLGSVSEKEIEVRKEIFELITKNEVLSKPLKERQMVLNEYLAKLNSVVDAVKPENIADTLCKRFVAIRANCETWVKDYLRIPEDALKGYQNCQSEAESLSGVVDRADEEMVTMRDMLKTSDGVCVDRYLKCRKELKSSLLEQDELIKKLLHLEECKDIDEIIEELVIKAFQQIRIPVFFTGCEEVLKLRSVRTSKEVRKAICWYRHLSAFRGIETSSFDFINISPSPLYPYDLNLSVLKEKYGEFIEEQIPLHQQLRQVATVRRYGNYAALHSGDDELAIVDLCSDVTFRCIPVSYILFDLLYFACCSLDTFILVFGHCGDLVKKFYSLQNRKPLRSFELKCVSRPKCVAASAPLTAFADQRNSINIVKDENDRKRILIPSAELKMGQIDKLMFMEKLTLVLFDYKERKIITLKITDTGGLMKWEVANAMKVSLPCSDQVTEFGFFNDSKVFALINDKLFAQ